MPFWHNMIKHFAWEEAKETTYVNITGLALTSSTLRPSLQTLPKSFDETLYTRPNIHYISIANISSMFAMLADEDGSIEKRGSRANSSFVIINLRNPRYNLCKLSDA